MGPRIFWRSHAEKDDCILEKIRKQIEYYLGDANLKKDKFFCNLLSEGSKGYVDIKVFLKCNKIKELLSFYNYAYEA